MIVYTDLRDRHIKWKKRHIRSCSVHAAVCAVLNLGAAFPEWLLAIIKTFKIREDKYHIEKEVNVLGVE